eukprot:2172744-Rhodomonas_salina.2
MAVAMSKERGSVKPSFSTSAPVSACPTPPRTVSVSSDPSVASQKSCSSSSQREPFPTQKPLAL